MWVLYEFHFNKDVYHFVGCGDERWCNDQVGQKVRWIQDGVQHEAMLPGEVIYVRIPAEG